MSGGTTYLLSPMTCIGPYPSNNVMISPSRRSNRIGNTPSQNASLYSRPVPFSGYLVSTSMRQACTGRWTAVTSPCPLICVLLSFPTTFVPTSLLCPYPA
ncbi:hypothetical protein M422DRAFT_33462 [Sphaerobolus stellatus SS14]|uniref:Uncharacterized protein n=1 Tax=Sphaerobolus stellatus (strain SS14) TaxID=990650 RepID=A0A0C9VKR6_SPHS4|nr:hypothetical protein M422DRAFT_33462 [Sphaerobolus stellatus SS14]